MLCDDEIRNYDACTDLLLSNNVLPTEALLGTDCESTDENHRNSLCQYYDNVVESIILAGVNAIVRDDRIIITAQVRRNLRQTYMTCLVTFIF